MYIATWNLKHRAGTGGFRREAADAAIALAADVLVFTEYFPREHENHFRSALSQAGWTEQLISEQTNEVANRVLIASKLPLAQLALELPTFDQQFPSNILGVRLPSLELSIVGVRVPAYSSKTKTSHLRPLAWEWLKTTAESLKNTPAVIIGDMNAEASTRIFRRTFAEPWHRTAPREPTFFGHKGKISEIDHILATGQCILSEVRVEKDTASDHAALICRVETSTGDQK